MNDGDKACATLFVLIMAMCLIAYAIKSFT